MKGVKKCILSQKLFIILALLLIPFLALLKAENSSAATPINSILASQSTFSKNFQSTVYTQTLNTQPLPAQVLAADSNMTGFWHYRLNYVFSNPVTNHSGTGYNHTVYFTLYSNYNLVNADLYRLMGNVSVSFEGIPANQNYCTSSYDITSLTNNSVRFRVTSSCPYNSFSSNQNFQNVQVVVDYTPDSLFWCANDSSKVCPSGVPYIYLSNVDYNFELLTDVQDSYNQTIINQNQTIINQNQQIIEQDNQDRTDLQNNSENSQSDAEQAGEEITQASASLLTIIGNYINIILNPPESNCQINMSVLFSPYKSGNYGNADLCSLAVPNGWNIIGSFLLIGLLIPFVISTINTFLYLLKGATQD